MTIKLIACDLDGTLVGTDLTFSPRLLDAVRRAQARGITVTLATGRGFPSTRAFARRLGIDAPVICYQGAQIKSAGGELLYEAALPRTFLPEMLAYCLAQGRELSVYCDDQIYQATRMHDQAYYDLWFGLPIHQVDDLLAALPGDPIKFIAIAPDQAEGDRLEREIRTEAAGRFQVVRSHAWFVEGLARGVSKGDSLARLARRLGIAQDEVMALGDSGNDAAMVAWAGWGVAIGNASDDVKSVANAIAPPQDEDGAAWAIERYALQEEPAR
jgi:Cof subfamily protein (haloacid dehalogenase superfamily)